MSDLISRQAVDEAIWTTLCNRQFESDRVVIEKLQKKIDALPSAPDSRQRGEWMDIDNYYRTAICSHCHKVTMFEKWGEHTKPYNFCPNCGADMRGAGDESTI